MRRCCYRKLYQNIIDENELQSLVQRNKVYIIDVRSEQEYYEGHFCGAINVPLYVIKRRIGEVCIDKEKIIVVYCDAGIRSAKAVKVLNSMGYKKVYNFVYNIFK